MHKEKTRLCVANYFAAIRAMDIQKWLANFAPQATMYDPVGTPPMQGHAALQQYFLQVGGAFKQVKLIEQDVFICGERAAVKWQGEGIGHNGRSVAFAGIDVFEVDAQGKIVQMWGYWNPAAMFAELNAV